MLNRTRVAATLAVVTLAAAARPAPAAPYETAIDVETEEDLDDLLATGQLTPETHGALRALLDRGVDLDTASRDELYSLPNLTYADVDAILAYRALNGFIADPTDLVAAGALTADKLLAISSFLVVRGRERGRYQPRGSVRISTRASQGDDTLPPVGVKARVTAGKDLAAGLVVTLTRLRVGDVVWDANRDALLADPAGVQAHVPKAYVRYHTDKLDLIAGTYRIGFGERLTFDTALDYTPNGIYTDDQLDRSYDLARACRQSTGELASSPCPADDRAYVTPDFSWSEGLRGLAVGTEHIPLGQGRLQAFGWGSYQHRSIYQYEVVDRGACADPRADDAACSAPAVYVRPDGDLLSPTPTYAYQTLPAMFAESLVGGNLTYFAARRDFVGVTAYGATTSWLPDTPDDVRLDTQEWSRWPIGGRHGAIGAQLGIGRGIYDVFAEVTHSFDRIPDGVGPVHGGGGPAAVLRATRNLKKSELEVALRYFDPDFVNPYAGATGQPDEVEGQRLRGEHGLRVRYTGTFGAQTVRAGIEAWRTLAGVDLDRTRPGIEDFAYVARGEAYVRADIEATEQLRWGAGIEYADKGPFEPDGATPCYEVLFEDGEVGVPITCFGKRLATTLRARLQPRRVLTLTGEVRHSYLDGGRGSKRHDVSARLAALWKPTERVRLELRTRFRDEDVADNAVLERSLLTSAEARYRMRAKDHLRVRADLRLWLDQREYTQLREPSPELWLSLDYEAKF